MKAEQQFKGKKILVLGLAKSGEAAARLLARLGASVTVNDQKPYEENEQAQALEKEGISVVCGGHPLSLLEQGFNLIVKNPGIPYHNPLIVEAEKRSIPIVTEIEIASRISEAEIVAITGSNGKTTTTTLAVDMLKGSKRDPLVAGNIGTVACAVAEKATAEQLIVMEVSSFQLMGTIHFHPKVAVLLNLFDAHLDYHGTKEHYIKAKKKIFENLGKDDYFVYNADDPIVRELAREAKAQLVPFSTTNSHLEGAYLKHGQLFFKEEPIIHVDDIVLPGSHNLENILAAIAATKLMGAATEQIQHVLKTFSGVKHRLQFVGTKLERRWYNDSKATNILASQKALSAFEQPVILLAGGLDRGNEFDELIPSLRGVKAVVAFGETKHKIAQAAKEAGVKAIQFAERVEDGVLEAYKLSEQSDVILLSPACASWDQYRTFEERGDSFIHAIEKLARSE
ncbi:UDP-N-acetylmuramoyl-L-alanine--D-glutamate ligase [Halalkalibacterium ligniniphilum]|uniref:UDP-N-acetylmuramoyl-L-alanine--D-glutamate ligase n=1 Tax=Halalkalibacterium ligniniphilum TaxID=1134413 RepID=UPI000344EE48|nr:UDP-N-acetylmuramoyl-L-alanine--D-glutamate ligase [Halalkalibacterium ligniniphilum]